MNFTEAYQTENFLSTPSIKPYTVFSLNNQRTLGLEVLNSHSHQHIVLQYQDQHSITIFEHNFQLGVL